ncbi:MAG: tetratricopeptide repeat protein [Treponema sp.]|jgi:tetratricopeptide (TPR) repeat protein|nr:tetratricopeptide repeat protein [Treponema sp.]
MDAEKPVEGLIQIAYDKLKASDFTSALAALEEALKIEYDHPEVIYGLKCLRWWGEHTKRLDTLKAPYEKGGYILSQWKLYYRFLDLLPGTYEPCQYAIKQFVFSTALGFFHDLLGDGENQHDPELLFQVGRCYKGVGDYDEALKYLIQAIRFRQEDSETIAELADVNALMGESRVAKALFREAFFLDPQKIDLRNIESELLLRLGGRVKELGYSGPELSEWIPVYGCLFGVFSVKRELKPVELGRLRQSIFSLENEIRTEGNQNSLLKPRLINRYFWLVDHYESIREDPGTIEETMMKIKLIDPAVYEQYIR